MKMLEWAVRRTVRTGKKVKSEVRDFVSEKVTLKRLRRLFGEDERGVILAKQVMAQKEEIDSLTHSFYLILEQNRKQKKENSFLREMLNGAKAKEHE